MVQLVALVRQTKVLLDDLVVRCLPEFWELKAHLGDLVVKEQAALLDDLVAMEQEVHLGDLVVQEQEALHQRGERPRGPVPWG
ncbi:hypothetical protein MTO96_001537 [Rhipicephalus appendiculatus]